MLQTGTEVVLSFSFVVHTLEATGPEVYNYYITICRAVLELSVFVFRSKGSCICENFISHCHTIRPYPISPSIFL